MSKDILVLYKTKYGSTKKYAKWIAEELNADLFELDQIKIEEIAHYQTIIYGGSLYAVGILGFKKIKKYYPQIKHKLKYVFTVGASPDYDEVVEDIKKSNFTPEMKDHIRYYHFRGGFDYAKMTLKHKIMMILLKKNIQKKKSLTKDEKGLLHVFDKPTDWTQKKNMKPLIDDVRRNR